MKPLKIFHIYANQQNLGDWTSALGIQKFLRNNYDGEMVFQEHFGLQGLSKNDITEINKTCDAVVVGGGGFLQDRRLDPRKILLDIKKSELLAIQKPLFTYSIGINYEKKFTKRLTQNADFFTKHFQDNSVRDHKTQEIIKNSKLVLCSAMLIQEPKREVFEIKKIGIVLVPLGRVPSAEEYVEKTSKLIKELQTKNIEVFLITQSKIPDNSYYAIGEKTSAKLLLPSNPSLSMDFYNEMDLIISSRGHGLIFATGQEKPFINLSYNIKCDEFCKDIGYPNNLSFQVGDFEVEQIMQAIDYVKNNLEELKTIMKKAKKTGTEQNNTYSKSIINHITNE